MLRLLKRAIFHDISKYTLKEALPFSTLVKTIRHTTYGSEEYFRVLASLQNVINLHYSRNRHHPEFFGDYKRMNFIDLIEMAADWNASSKKNLNNNLKKSILISQERFKISDEIGELLRRLIMGEN